MMDPRPNRLYAGDPRAMQSADESGTFPRRGQPATFSRFVLPLPYWLTKCSSDAAQPAHYFEEAAPNDWLHSATQGNFNPAPGDFAAVFEATLDQERRDYFTRETGEVLFRRARWCVLRGMGDTVFQLPVRRDDEQARVTVHLRPPALVLFEYPDTPKDGVPEGTLPHAMLVVEAWWDPGKYDTAPQLEDLLVFNELFRYFQRPFERHARRPPEDGHPKHNYRRELANLPVDWRSPGELLGNAGPKANRAKAGAPEKPEAVKEGSVDKGAEDLRRACYLRRWEWILECPIRLPGRPSAETTDAEWWSLVPPDWITNARRWVLGESAENARADADGEGNSPAHGWLLYADNRAYVWTCAVVEDNAPVLDRVKALGEDVGRPVDTELGHWLRLVNVDPLAPKPGNCTAFEAQFAHGRTYRRWAHCGALQGFNYHGGAMLTGRCDEPPTWRHFGAMYFDQALLLLYLRVTLFRFSYALSQLSRAARARGDDREARAELKVLFERVRLDFALFTNLYQFPLLSNQQQGIELYTLCRENMDVEALFEEVKSEVEATHEFLSLDVQDKMAVLGGQLTVVATVGLVAALVLSAPGVNDLFNRVVGLEEWPWGALLLYVACLVAVFSLLVAESMRKSTGFLRLFENLAKFRCGGWLWDCLNRWLERQAELMQRRSKPPKNSTHDQAP